MYAPMIRSARAIKKYRFGSYEAVFLDQIVAVGSIEYEFIIAVSEPKATAPFLFVTSERNDPQASREVFEELGLEADMMPEEEGASHFLCLFDEQGHYNMGDSNDWGDVEKFEKKALTILTERLGQAPKIV